jgi:hypothetical protein
VRVRAVAHIERGDHSAVLFVGELAGFRRSRLAATGTGCGVHRALGAGYPLANDVVVDDAV